MTLKLDRYNDIHISDEGFERLKAGEKWLDEKSQAGEQGFGWIHLTEACIDNILNVASWLREFESVVQIGIGGSSLGNLMLHQALLPPHYNELSRDKRDGPRFYMIDNVDAQENSVVWDLINPENTAFIVVSKSGQTLETMANFLFFWKKIKGVLGEKASSRVVAITDDSKGLLLQFCEETGCKRLDLPSDVGGRYSVLSSVGLLSSAALGIDVKKILNGALAMKENISQDVSYEKNLAFLLSWNLVGQLNSKRPVTVFMPYGDRLECLAEWFCQLWAESLGKDGRGPTPLRALGAVDQHSQLQLYSEGPDDKVYVLLGVRPDKNSINTLDAAEEDSLMSLGYLSGLSLEEILANERRAITAVLAGKGRPVFSLEFSEFNEEALGKTIYLLEYITALSGYLMCIDPFNQPGVELGKFYTYGLCGRTGEEKYQVEVERLEKLYRTGTLNIIF